MRVLLINDGSEPLNGILPEVEKDYIVDIAKSGSEGSFQSQINEYDAIVINSEMSDINSYNICKIIRDAKIFSPILFLGSNEKSKIKSLDSGADYYLSKPVKPQEVRASIRALIRRNQVFKKGNTLQYQNIKVNLLTKQVHINSELIRLRRREYDVLIYFLHHKDKIVSKEELLEHVWEQGIYANSNIVEVTINTLRKKLKIVCAEEVIKTVKGFGYKVVNCL